MRDKRFAACAAAFVAGLLLAGCGEGDGGGEAESTTHTASEQETGTTGNATTQAGPGQGGQTVAVPVVELNGSGQSGTATLSELAGGTHVVLELRGGRGSQSADIRKGTCERPARRPEFQLQDLSSGRGETHVDVPLQALLSADYVILVQRSATDAKAHVACAYLAAL